MKKTILLLLALVLQMGVQITVNAQELTLSDLQYNCHGYSEDRKIILTKEGTILTVQVLNLASHPETEYFDITLGMSGGSDGVPCSVSIDVVPINYSETCVIASFDVSFKVHGLEANSFYFSCLWYDGLVNLTEGEPLVLGSIMEDVTIGDFTYVVDKIGHTAMVGAVKTNDVLKDLSIPSELEYEGQKYIVTNIGDLVFSNNTTLTSVTIPGSIASIGVAAFSGCSSLTSVVISEGVRSIKLYAFYGCTSLTSVTFPKSVTRIGEYAFANCSSLTDVYCLEKNVPKTVAQYPPFDNTPTASATLHVPAGSKDLYKTTSPWSEFGNIVEIPHQPLPFLEGNPIWVYKYEHIPRLRDPNIICWIDTGDRVYTYYFLGRQKEIEGKVYTMMGEVECSKEGEITLNRWYPVREENGIVYTITDSLPRVVEFGYDDVPYLEQGNECVLYNFSAEIGDTLYKNHVVKSFDTYQLIDGTVCRVLKTNGLPLYEKLGYRDDDGTYGVIDPLWGIAIATNGHAYTKCLNAYYQDDTMLYKAPDAPEGLCVNDTIWTTLHDTYIYARSYKADPYHDDVMAYIRQLQTTTEGNVTIDGLNYYLYPDTHVAIIDRGNTWSGELDIPSQVSYNGQTFIVKSMVWNAFYDCPELTKVKIPKTIEFITHHVLGNSGNGAVSPDYMNLFVGCTALESIEVDADNPIMCSDSGVLLSKDKTQLYDYPAGLRQEAYIIPETVTWIGRQAFSDCQYLTSLTIPNSMYICFHAFHSCSSLTDVYCYAENIPTTESKVFINTPIASATLHVPAGSIDLYKTTSPWSEFGNIVEIPLVTFTKGQVATIILPITPDADKGRYFRLDRWEDDKIILEEEPQPQARTPYVIVPNEDFSIDLSTLDVAGLRFDTVRIEAVSPYDPTRIKEIRFVGTYSKRYIGAKDNGFHLIILDTTSDCYYQEGGLGSIFMGPLRAHFEVHIVFCRNWKPWNKLVYELHSTDGTIVTTEDLVTFTEGQMATIILPTEPDASKGKYYRLDKCEDGQIIFEQELHPQARVPYIIIPNEDFSIDPNTIDLEGLSHDTVSIEGISFIGTYIHNEFNYQEEFYIDIIDTTPDCLNDWFGSGKAIVGALRAYLTVNWDDPISQDGTRGPKEKMEIVLKDHGTGINEIQDSKSKIQNEGAIFDLQGRRISSKPARGIYIRNGKKVVIK